MAEDLVTIEEVEKKLGVPRQIIYRRIKDGSLPVVDVTQPYHKRRQYRFNLDKVADALGMKPQESQRETSAPGK